MSEEISLSAVYKELQNQYISGIEQQDAKALNAFVRDDRVLLFKSEDKKDAYTTLRLYRAECFILFGMFTEGIKECRLALAFAPTKSHWEIYMLWTRLHYIQFIHATDDLALTAIAQAGAMIASKGRKAVSSSIVSEYQHLAFANNEAFFNLYLGEREAAIDAYKALKFTPIPIAQYNDDTALAFLFTNYAKGLAVAIELKDAKLLRNLLKVISIDDQVLKGDMSLFKIFHSTLITTMDTHPQFATEFNQLFLLQDKVKNQMKELNFFLTSIKANMMDALEVSFNIYK